MKKFIIGLILFGASALASLSSCKKTDTITPTTALATIQADASSTIFSAIEARSGDDSYINGSAAVIVPVDSAFINAGITATVAANLSMTACDSIIKYYSIPTGVNCGGTAGAQVALTTGLSLPLYADSSATSLFFNGVAASSITPVVVGTTSIYKVPQFINVPAASIAQIAAADTSLSLFIEAFNRTGLATNIGSGNFSLFMPTNSAFATAGYPDIASIDAANITTLTQLLLYHTVASRLLQNDLAGQTSLTTLQGTNIQVSTTSGMLMLTGNSDPSLPANLQNTGILAGNGVAYKINEVLLP